MSKKSKRYDSVGLETEPDEETTASVLSFKSDYTKFTPHRTSDINSHLSKAANSVHFYSEQGEKYKNLDCKNLFEVPLTLPDDLLKDPYQFVAGNSRPVQLTSSGGTYGKRKILFRTSDDIRKSAETAASMFSLAGAKEGDIVAIIQPFDLWNIGHIGMQAFKKIGALSIPLGLSAKEDEILDVLVFTKTTVLYGTPSKIASLATTSENRGLLTDLKISKVLCAGEPILNDHRKLVERLWGAEIFGIYGSEETDGIGAECRFHDGYHLLDKNSVFEVLDSQTLRPTEGIEGVLAVTNVGYTGTTLVRYLLGDKVQIDKKACECGEKSVRIRPRGRLEETVWLYAGTKITTRSVEELMNNFFEKVPLYQIVVEQKIDRDILTIRINSESNTQLSNTIPIAQEIGKVSQDLRSAVDSGRIIVKIELSSDLSFFESTIRGKQPKIIYKKENK